MLIANFISDPKSRFYRSDLFISIMNFVNKGQKKMTIRQTESRLSLAIGDINSVGSAIQVLEKIYRECGGNNA